VQWPAGAEVLSVDLDVRDRSDAAAHAAMAAAAHLGPAQRVFVKIDSTLRGPLVGLVGGALDAFGRERAIVAPAFPEQGRTLRAGRLHVDGRPGPNLHELLEAHAARCEIVDAETAVELRQVDEAARNHPEWLLVGSAGLARQLAPPHVPLSVRLERPGPVLVVAGSPTAVTRAQVERLAGLRGVVILASPQTGQRDAGEAAEALADSVAEWAREETPSAVILTGGATARAVSHRLRAAHLRILGELQPGVPVGKLQDGAWHDVAVVTKAGGFGTPDTLLDVVRALGVSSS
jgi:uncharacterized protein YgbK (DUF1537 family)